MAFEAASRSCLHAGADTASSFGMAPGLRMPSSPMAALRRPSSKLHSIFQSGLPGSEKMLEKGQAHGLNQKKKSIV